MAAREWLWLVKESAYGTQKSTPVAGTDSIFIRLDGGNAFSMRPKPKQVDVMMGGGLAIKGLKVSGETPVSGSLQTKLCYSQALLLLGWCASRINTAQTAPWTTTEPAGDLASVVIYHAIQRIDGTYKIKAYPGCKVDKWKLECSKDSVVATLSIDIVAQKVTGNSFDASSDPTTTPPTDAQYATDLVIFQHSVAGLKIANGGTARTAYESFSIDCDNTLDATACESRWLSYLRMLGRKATLSAKLILKPSPDDRASYEALTAQACSLALTNVTNTITIDFKGTNYLSDVGDDLPLEKIYEQTLKIDSLYDTTAGTDFSIAFV